MDCVFVGVLCDFGVGWDVVVVSLNFLPFIIYLFICVEFELWYCGIFGWEYANFDAYSQVSIFAHHEWPAPVVSARGGGRDVYSVRMRMTV